MFEGVVGVKAGEGSEGKAVALTFVILIWKQTQSLVVLAVVGLESGLLRALHSSPRLINPVSQRVHAPACFHVSRNSCLPAGDFGSSDM